MFHVHFYASGGYWVASWSFTALKRLGKQLLLVTAQQLPLSCRRYMKRVAIVLLAFANSQVIYGTQPDHSTSPSRQFLIYGADAKTRGAISGLAEQTKTNFLALLRQRDDWKTL